MRVVSAEQLAHEVRARADAALGRPPGEFPGTDPVVRVVASGNFAAPQRLLDVLDRAVDRYRLFMLNATGALPDRNGVIFETPFVGPSMRHRGLQLDYLPMRLSLVPQLFRRSRPPDIVLAHTSAVHRGRVSLGIEVNIMVAAIEQTRARGGLVVAQVNPNMPYTYGDAELDCDHIDLAMEADEPIPSPAPHPRDEVSEAIASRTAARIDDCCTLQLGIGAVPDSVLDSVTTRRDLSVWSEMISDGVLALDRAGAMDQDRPIVASFLFGSPELYRWVDRNPRIQMVRTETSNDPGIIARQPKMVSINGALQVDLFAQVNADRVRGEIFSGFGGQPDFTVGALHSCGGQAIIALPSWHPKSATSTVVPTIGAQVTSFQHSALVTEHGTAEIFGRSQRAQARLIIDHIAHPDARDELRSAAAELGLA